MGFELTSVKHAVVVMTGAAVHRIENRIKETRDVLEVAAVCRQHRGMDVYAVPLQVVECSDGHIHSHALHVAKEHFNDRVRHASR